MQTKTTKPKTKSLEELEDKYFGKTGTSKREQYESQVRLEVIGELIKQTRQVNQLTQSQLAKKLGMDKTYVSRMENNVKTQRLDTLIKVLKALKCHMFIQLPSEEGTKQVELI